MSKLRLAIVGAGHLGRIHARIAAGLAGVNLVGIVDPDASSRTRSPKRPAFPRLPAFMS